MCHNKLSTKKTIIISSGGKSSTSYLFQIYDFYDDIEEIITKKKLGPSQIWNTKETRFPMDLQKLKVIVQVGEVGFTTTGGKKYKKIQPYQVFVMGQVAFQTPLGYIPQ